MTSVSAPPAPAPSAPRSRFGGLAWLLLLAQMGVVAGWLGWTGKLRPQLVPDSPGYVDFPWHSPRQALGHLRTPAYPAFLKVAGFLAAEQRAVPAAQMCFYFGAAALLFWALRQGTGATGVSLAAASGLLYANILHGYVSTVATDTLAAAAGIAAVALTIRFVARPSFLSAVGIAMAATAGWLVRPAYLFLVVLCPLLAWLVVRVRREGLPRAPGRIGLALRVLALTAGPLLAYCTLRAAVVGQFGVVSFGGYNLVGVSGQFLTPADLDRLPAEVRPIAETVLDQRASAQQPVSPYDNEPPLHYLRLETRYDHTIWNEFKPAAEKVVGVEPAAINPRLKTLGATLVRNHPRDYAVWLVKATRQGAKKLTWDFLDNPVGLVTSLLLAAVLALTASLRGFAGSWTDEVDWAAFRILVLTTIAYAATSLAVVIPVCPPLGRFTDAAGVFAGGLSMGGLWLLVRALGRREIPAASSGAASARVS